MNILVINGSPKGERSNTVRLTQAFLDGMVETVSAGEKDGPLAPNVETISTSRLDIKPCRGCFACWSETPGTCVIHDDMASVIEKLVWADVTIWSFPLYYFGLPGPLKNLVDRQLPMNLPFMTAESEAGGHPSRYDMTGKRTVVISTCGFYTAQGNYDGVRATFDHLCGKDGYARIFCGQGELFRVPELAARTDEYLEAVRQAGRDFAANGAIAAGTQALLDQLLFPRETFEAMADASWGVVREGEHAGEKEDDSLVFTRQMAALYNRASWSGRDRALQMNYTDIGKVYQIVLGEKGSSVTEGDGALPESASPNAAVTRINTPLSVWQSIAVGEISGTDAMMRHLYTVDGDFSLMLRWDDFFGGPSSSGSADGGAGATAATAGGAAGAAESVTGGSVVGSSRKTSWLALLLPWTALWFATQANVFWGGLGVLAMVALLPVLLSGSRRTVYDLLTMAMVGLCAVALLAGAPLGVVLVASYLGFAALWLGSCATKVPLSAHYSLNQYGGEKALQNVVFVHTNVILSAGWGIVYLVIAGIGIALIAAGMSQYVIDANTILPALMGIFTAWFQRWYPARVARG